MPRNESNSNKVILVVEDDEQVRKLVSTVLTKAGYIVVAAKDRTEFVLLPKAFLPKDLLNGIAAALKRAEAGRNHHHS